MLSPVKISATVPISEVRDKRTHQSKDAPIPQESNIKVSIGQHPSEPITYAKPYNLVNKIDDPSFIKRLEEFYEPLRLFVDKLVSQQDDLIKKISAKIEKVEDKELAELQQLVSEQGEFGVIKTSHRIVEFAKAISGGDKSKIGELKEAVEMGFKKAEEALGQLPEISLKTREEVMKKLDEWEKS